MRREKILRPHRSSARRCATEGPAVLKLLALLIALTALPATAYDLALVNGKIYPSPTAPAIGHGTILIHNGQIIAVGPSEKLKPPSTATIIDCTNKVITAGFWNSHVHFTEPEWQNSATAPAIRLEDHMETMLTRWGFTTVFDLGSFPDNTHALRARVNNGEIAGPRIFTVLAPLYPENGIPVYLPAEFRIPQATAPAVARAMAEQDLSLGANGIKVFAGAIVKGGVLPMDPDIIRAAVEVAHAAGKPVFAHPSNHAGTDSALNGGVDVLAHTIPMEDAFTPSELRRMGDQHVALIPTISLFPDEERKFGGTAETAKAVTNTSITQLKSAFDQGIPILFGTDVGYTALYDTTSEYQYMSRSGMTYRDILASLTTTPATFFKTPHTGRIEKGLDADLTILCADPQADPKNFARVAYTIRAGKIIYKKLIN